MRNKLQTTGDERKQKATQSLRSGNKEGKKEDGVSGFERPGSDNGK